MILKVRSIQLEDEVERDIPSTGEARVAADDNKIKTLVESAINTIENYFNRQGVLSGVPTGFTDFDRMTDGLHGGEMIVIAARPSMGKTSLAMNIAEHVVLNQKLPVGVFSLEMTAESLVLRNTCSNARVNLRSIREGFMSEHDFPKITTSAARSPTPRFSSMTPPNSVHPATPRQGPPHVAAIWHQTFCDLLICSHCTLLRDVQRITGSRRSPIFPAASNRWRRN